MDSHKWCLVPKEQTCVSQLLALIAVHANLCILLHLDGACEMPDCISFCRNSGVSFLKAPCRSFKSALSYLRYLHKLFALLLQWQSHRSAVQFRAFGQQTAENLLLSLNMGGLFVPCLDCYSTFFFVTRIGPMHGWRCEFLGIGILTGIMLQISAMYCHPALNFNGRCRCSDFKVF